MYTAFLWLSIYIMHLFGLGKKAYFISEQPVMRIYLINYPWDLQLLGLICEASNGEAG